MSRRLPTEAERQARREADLARARHAVEALRTSEGWKRWLSLRRHFHGYSLANQLLISLQLPTATRVAGFRAWLKLGYCVRRGERAIRIWMPIPPSRRDIASWEDEGSPTGERPRMRFKLGPVFDRSQVEPLPPPAAAAPLDPPVAAPEGDDLAWALPRLAVLAREVGCVVATELLPANCGGYFRPATRTIALNASISVNHQVKTFVHELAHALLHGERPEDEREFSYAEEELVVESVAFTVCGAIGLDTSGYSVPYLASWSESAELETVQTAAAVIDGLASRIEAAVLAEPEVQAA